MSLALHPAKTTVATPLVVTTAVAVAEKALKAYGVNYARVLPPQKGYRNRSFPVEKTDGTMINLILYKKEPGILARIQAANAVSGYLAARGFAVRRTVDERIVRLQTADSVRYGSLYNYLDGHTIPWESYSKNHIKVLGKTMSDMHFALRGFSGRALPEVADEYLAVLSRMRRYFDQAPVRQAMHRKLGLDLRRQKLQTYEQLLRAARQLSGKQPLHMDFVRSNILFKGVTLTGILDFEKTASGHPVFDIARTLAFLLVDCKYKSESQVRKYFLGSGYAKRGAAPLPGRTARAFLEPLIKLFLLHDFYKFLRHNPYESLHENEHFIRTRDLLLERGVVTSSTS